MKHYSITNQIGYPETIVHFDGENNNALCGEDLTGETGWTAGKRTIQKVNCPICVKIVEACKSVPRSEYTKKRKP